MWIECKSIKRGNKAIEFNWVLYIKDGNNKRHIHWPNTRGHLRTSVLGTALNKITEYITLLG